MPIIKPISDLRNNFKEISDICHKEGKPVFITKNGKGNLVVMSIAKYEAIEADLKKYQALKMAEQAPVLEKRVTKEEMLEKSKQPLGDERDSNRRAQYRSRRELLNKVFKLLEEEKVAMLIRGSRGKHGTFFTSGGGIAYKKDTSTSYASIDMAPEHANLMARLIENGIEVKIEADIQTTFYEDNLNSFNVVGDIPGTDKKLKSELVMLGGHLDSWHAATGAVDNAAGCIVMMEAVRILQAIGIQPKRTIRIALWSGEEQGLHGSRNYVKNHFANRQDMSLKPDYDNLSAYYSGLK